MIPRIRINNTDCIDTRGMLCIPRSARPHRAQTSFQNRRLRCSGSLPSVSCIQMDPKHAEEAEDAIIHVMIDLNRAGPMILERPDPDQERYRLAAARQLWKLYDEHW